MPEQPLVKAESREEKIERLETQGSLDPTCPGCKEFYEHQTLSPFAPSHRASAGCESGRRPHCTCDTCF